MHYRKLIPAILTALLPIVALGNEIEEIDADTFQRLVAAGQVAECTVTIAGPAGSDRTRTVEGVYTSGEEVKRFSTEVIYTEALDQLVRENVPTRRTVTRSNPNMVLLLSLLPFLCVPLAIFWIWMLTDCLRKDHPRKNDKLVWVVTIILTNVIGAILYFLMQRRKAATA